jgi:hypothetical protein
MNSVLRYLRKCVKAPPPAELSDGHLLERFVTQREEAAFEFLFHTKTGLPSGQGALQANCYYLPLEIAASGKPEIYVFDIAKGKVVKRLRLANDAVPGNLVFTDAILVSQGVRSLIAVRQQ